MFILHTEMYKFYRDHVRLSADQRRELAGYRDTNYERLKDGLEVLDFPKPVRKCDQGSYAMHTTNKHPNKDYDIDVAIIFDKDDLPSSALDARKRVESAMIKGGGNFSRPPEARTNAVTVWYQEGHHVDLAVHRRYFDFLNNEIIEHAGTDWTERDPQEITNWFNTRVTELSPSKDTGATVENGQMRRVVQLLKMFVKSRPSWQDSGKTLPGGLIISALVGEECYRPEPDSDEKALYYTIVSLKNRLQSSSEVKNPVDPTQSLTDKDEYRNQVKRFNEKLEKVIEWLEPLLDGTIDKETAAKAWKRFFNHDYWDELVDQISEAKSLGEALRTTSFVASTGKVSPTPPSEKHIETPHHRYYGDE